MSDQPTDPHDEPVHEPGHEPVDDSRNPVQRPSGWPSDPTSDSPSDSPSGSMPFADTVRAKFEEYDVEGHLEDFAAQLEQVVRHGVETVGALAHEHRDDIGGFLSRTAETLDRRTDGRHAETISQVRGQLERGVERLAEQRPPDTGPSDATGPSEET
jgi:hypothetical protein